MNLLLNCADQCIKGSGWKESVQSFEANSMINCYGLKTELLAGTFRASASKQFVQIERGKARPIKAPSFSDRVVQKAMNQAVLLPEIIPRLIYDNGASVKGKGNDFGRRRFEAHIHKHFQQRGDNGGFVLFGDFSKYFDNLLHEQIKAMVRPIIPHQEEYALFCEMIDNFQQDVSFMSAEEYEAALTGIFNSMAYLGYSGPREKLLPKGCDIGAEISQTAGIFVPHRIDNYFKNVRSVKFYGRYMDDTYMIGNTVEELKQLRQELKEQAQAIGIHLNEKKTYIQPLTKPFVWLKIKYTLTPTGHLVRSLDHNAIVRERKRIKYLAAQLQAGKITRKYAENCYLCWRFSKKKFDSHRSIESLDRLYRELIGPIDVYKKDRRKRP